MKHIPAKMILGALCAFLLLGVAACKDSGGSDDAEYAYLFTNASGHSVTVRPNGQSSWSSFVLASGGSKTVSIPETVIYFLYNQADYIKCDTTTTNKIRFYNRTLLGIRNSTTADLDLISWRGYYFGSDLVYDAVLGKYVKGLKPGSGYVNEVSAGSGYVYFWFAAGGPKYRTTTLVKVDAEAQLIFTFYGSTIVTTASLVASPRKGGEKAPDLEAIGIEPVPGSDDSDRRAEERSVETAPKASQLLRREVMQDGESWGEGLKASSRGPHEGPFLT